MGIAHPALFEHTQLCSSTHSTAPFEHTQLCSSTQAHTALFEHTYNLIHPCTHVHNYAKLVQAHTTLTTLLASSTGHSAAAAALLVHAAAALLCSPHLLVVLLQLSSDRYACSVVNGLETVAAMGVLSQPGPCAWHVRRCISHQ